MRKEITLSDIAGYATERAVWQMLLSLSDDCATRMANGLSPQAIAVVGNEFSLREARSLDADHSKAFAAPETFGHGAGIQPERSGIWTLGALAFYLITGMDVFEGKGGKTQTKDTGIPRISSAHASKELSTLIRRCLSYSPQERPAKEEIKELAQATLTKPVVPRKKLASQSGKSYASSLIKFWPEEMVTMLLVCLLHLCPMTAMAQPNPAFDKSAIPNEMASLVLRCIDLRSSQNVAKVSRAMDRDMNWTMMDELPLDKEGECTTKDAVDMFGLNDMGFSILKRHGGVTNAGGRFRDGRDPRYKYSFIEITVKQGKTVNYNISGREGEQMFAIVPFDRGADFQASIKSGETRTGGNLIDGACYIQLKQGIKKTDSFTLTIRNSSGKNMAFALINYNSRNNE